jgi:hypothetical protein
MAKPESIRLTSSKPFNPYSRLCLMFRGTGLVHVWQKKPEHPILRKIFPYRQFKQVERESVDSRRCRQLHVLGVLRPATRRSRQFWGAR